MLNYNADTRQETMEITLALLADAANFSLEGKLNILGSFNVINVASLPATHPEMQMVIRLEAEPAERSREKLIEILLLGEDGARLRIDTIRMRIPDQPRPGESPRWTGVAIYPLRSVQFTRAGLHRFDILVSGETKAQVQLIVNQREVKPQ